MGKMDHIPFNVLAENRPRAVIGNPRADGGNVAALLTELKAQVSGMREQVMPLAERADREARAAGDASAEVKAAVDALMPKFNEHCQAVAKLEGQLEAIEARTLDVEQLAASGGGGGAPRLSAGQELAQSDELKAWIAGGLSGSLAFTPQAAITSATAGGWSQREAETVSMPRRRFVVRDLLNVVPTSAGSIDYRKQTVRTLNAAAVAEGAAAPESVVEWALDTAIVRKLSHWVPMTDEALADTPRLQGEVDGELRFGLDLVEEQQLLTGDGTGENLTGLVTEATAFNPPAALAAKNDRMISRLRLAMLQVVLNDYAADGFVLSPVDWAGIELETDTTGRYLVDVSSDLKRLWRLPVAECNTMTAGSWLCGSFQMAATLYDRMRDELLISSEHADNFTRGMKTIKATRRLALAVKRPASLVTGDFTFA